MVISRIISVGEMEDLVRYRKLTYKQISDLLSARNPSVKNGLSVMSIRRFCKANGINKYCNLNKSELEKKVLECAANVSF